MFVVKNKVTRSGVFYNSIKRVFKFGKFVRIYHACRLKNYTGGIQL